MSRVPTELICTLRYLVRDGKRQCEAVIRRERKVVEWIGPMPENQLRRAVEARYPGVTYWP